MSLAFFGLREQPFELTPSPRYFYPSPAYQGALTSLLYGIESRRGFLGLIADAGMGKTTLLYALLERLRTSARTAFVVHTGIGPHDCLRSILTDLDGDISGQDSFELYQQLYETLTREAKSARPVVLIIDEAQDLEAPVLETVRILSNFETTTAKLMNIVMAGQATLADKLAQPALVQLAQRLSIVARLKPLNDAETSEYIDYRLRVAGYTAGSLFTPEACALIAARSAGVPRNINSLCCNALLRAYAWSRRTIDPTILEDLSPNLERGSSGEERHRVRHATRQSLPAASLVVEHERLPASSLDPAVKQCLTDAVVPWPVQENEASSVVGQGGPEETATWQLLDSLRSSIRAGEGGLGAPPVMPGLFYRLAGKRTARVWLAAAVAILCCLLLLLLFGSRYHRFGSRYNRMIRVAPQIAIAPASRPAPPGSASIETRGVEARKTFEAGSLKSSDRSLRVAAPRPTSLSRSRAKRSDARRSRLR